MGNGLARFSSGNMGAAAAAAVAEGGQLGAPADDPASAALLASRRARQLNTMKTTFLAGELRAAAGWVG